MTWCTRAPTPKERRIEATLPKSGAASQDPADPLVSSPAVSRSELKEATFKSLRWATLARIAAEAATLTAAIVMAHLVPPAEFGRVAITVVVSELALALANEGAGAALVQRRVLERAHVESAAMLALAVGVVLTLTTLLVVPVATTPLFGERTTALFQLCSPAFTFAAIGIIPLAMLERQLDFRRISMIEIATVLVAAVASVGFAITGLNAEAYILGMLCGMAVWTVLLVTFGPAVLPRWRPRQMREIGGFALPGGLAGTAMVGYGNVDYLILGTAFSPAQVGFYYRAYTVGVQYQGKISAIIARIAFPVYSRTESLDHMRAVRARIMRINAAVIFPILALFIAVAPQLVPWVFGERWEPAVLPAQILTVAGMARMINNGTPPLMMAAGRPRELLAFNLCRVAVLAAAIILAVPLGLTAVCIATAIFQVVTLICSYWLMLGRLVGVTLRQLALDIGPATAASGIVLAVAAPLAHALSTGGLSRPLTVLLTCALCAPLYLVALRLISPAAWADLLLLARRVLLPRLRRGTPPPAPEAPAAAGN